MEEKKRMKTSKKVFLWFCSILVVLVAAFGVYVSIYYKAQDTAKELLHGNDLVQVKNTKMGIWLDGPGESDAVIFYPGAKVEHTAYMPVWFQVAEGGVDVFIVEMPFRLAMFGYNRAISYREVYDYQNWYMAGHSLGGAMAANYVSKHLDDYKGLILLAAYPTKNLKSDHFSVLSIYGSEDHVLSMEHYEAGKKYMPSDYTEFCIEGGNHGQFADYGFQNGDGKAVVTKEEQWGITSNEILKYIRK